MRVAVLIPCYNEELSIACVVQGFARALPGACIHVYDNNSRDRTIELATAAGAIVRREALQGKGHVVRRMFADIEADIYVLVDGDNTYSPEDAATMIAMLIDGPLDMVTASRVTEDRLAWRPGHRLGNVMLTGSVRLVFGNRVRDMLSGYRVFSRRFVKTFPALASGFETETEFTVHALELGMPVGELNSLYRARQAGSVSKLRTYADGTRILRMIVILVKQERPLAFFSLIGLVLLLAALLLAIPVVITFLHTRLVPRLPTAVLATGLTLLSFLSLACGMILDSVTRGRKEAKRLAYLAVPACPGPAVASTTIPP